MASKETSTKVPVPRSRQETSCSSSGALSFRESSWSSSASQMFLIESSSDESPFGSSEMMGLEVFKTREDAMASSGSSGVSSKVTSSDKSSSQTDAVPVPSSSGEDLMSSSSLLENEEIPIHEDDVSEEDDDSASSGENPMSVASSILSNETPGGVGGGIGGGDNGNNWNVAQLLSLARQMLPLFLMMADNLDKHHKNFNVARIAGASVATIGGGVAIAAAIASFFTFGVSIIIVIVGGAVAAAGGMTSGGAGIFQYIISKKNLKEAEQKWAEFGNMYRNALGDHNFANQTGSGPASLATAAGSAGGAVFAAVAREAAIAAGGAGGRIAATAGRFLAAAATTTIVINAVMLGFSLYDIIDGSLEIHRERKSPVGDIIRRMATALQMLIAHLEGRQGGE